MLYKIIISINVSNKLILHEHYLIQYDQNGHIVSTKPIKKQITTVNNIVYSQYDGNADSNINFGDDFTINNNSISLKWEDINQ